MRTNGKRVLTSLFLFLTFAASTSVPAAEKRFLTRSLYVPSYPAVLAT